MKAPKLVLRSNHDMDVQISPNVIWLPAHDPEDQLDNGEENPAEEEALEEEEEDLDEVDE